MNIKEEIEKLGFKIVYIPHKLIKDYNACYNVRYRGKTIRPKSAIILKIPLNEIWISEKFKKFEKYILFHELREIKYRRKGYSKKTAHEKADKDEISLWKDDPRWKKMNKEMGIGRKHLVL